LELFDAKTISTFNYKRIVNEITQSSEESAVVSLEADGASIMSGEFAGVAELLRSEHFHWLIYINCTAHHLNLMVNDQRRNEGLPEMQHANQWGHYYSRYLFSTCRSIKNY
jgi:hypothetical protein